MLVMPAYGAIGFIRRNTLRYYALRGLKKFHKHYHQVETALDRWNSFLTNAAELDKDHIPKELADDQTIVKAIEAVDRMFNDEERQIYEVRMQALADVKSKIASAAEKGKKKAGNKARKLRQNKPCSMPIGQGWASR